MTSSNETSPSICKIPTPQQYLEAYQRYVGFTFMPSYAYDEQDSAVQTTVVFPDEESWRVFSARVADYFMAKDILAGHKDQKIGGERSTIITFSKKKGENLVPLTEEESREQWAAFVRHEQAAAESPAMQQAINTVRMEQAQNISESNEQLPSGERRCLEEISKAWQNSAGITLPPPPEEPQSLPEDNDDLLKDYTLFLSDDPKTFTLLFGGGGHNYAGMVYRRFYNEGIDVEAEAASDNPSKVRVTLKQLSTENFSQQDWIDFVDSVINKRYKTKQPGEEKEENPDLSRFLREQGFNPAAVAPLAYGNDNKGSGLDSVLSAKANSAERLPA